jgi:SAM-dependent methyltransferase
LDLQRLQGAVGVLASAPRFDPLEARFRAFKERVNRQLVSQLGPGLERFLADYFLRFLPTIIRAAAEHEGLDQVDCAAERQLVVEVLAEPNGLLAHSPMIFPVNYLAFLGVPVRSPNLDLGIGNARNSSFSLRGRALDVGADIIVSNLLQARDRGIHQALVALDMGALPWNDGTFAQVTAFNSIYHVQGGRGAALDEMTRVLAPGGTLALTDVSPFLSQLKPLDDFFGALGFSRLRQEFERYFLAGYGADGTAGEEGWYRTELARRGYEEIELRYLMGPRLSRLGYLFYDWQALFNFDASGLLDTQGSDAEAYHAMLAAAVAPLIAGDAADCATTGQGGYLFVHARKRGDTPTLPASRTQLRCPVCRSPLPAETRSGIPCAGCGRTFPVHEQIPLLTGFYADAAARPSA